MFYCSKVDNTPPVVETKQYVLLFSICVFRIFLHFYHFIRLRCVSSTSYLSTSLSMPSLLVTSWYSVVGFVTLTKSTQRAVGLNQIFPKSLSKSLRTVIYLLTHSHTMKPFDASGKEAFSKHCGKRRKCW